MERRCPEVLCIPSELTVEFQTIIQRLHEKGELHTLIQDFYDNLAYIYHKHDPEYEDEYSRAVILMTIDESKAFEAAYETAQEYHEDIKSADNKHIYTALALHTVEEYDEHLTD